METKVKDLKIRMKRGFAKADKRQQKILAALGIRRTNQTVFHDASAIIKGMITKVTHLLEVTPNK